MRKILFALFLMAFVSPALVHAASVGGMTTAGQGKVAIGVSEDYVFDKDLKVKDLKADETEKINIDYMTRTTADISYGILEGLDIYTKLGVADLKLKGSGTYVDSGNPGTSTDVTDGKSAFVYGAGVKGVYDIGSGWLVGGDAQYVSHKNKFKMIQSGYDVGNGNWEDAYTGKMTIQEWQATLLVGKKIDSFTPYAGVKYSDMKVNMKIDDSDNKMKAEAKDNVGAIVGLDYAMDKNWKFNVEGRFIDETAVSGSVVFKF